MSANVSLLENTGSGASSASDVSTTEPVSFSGLSEPSIMIQTGHREIRLTGEDILLYASLVQTLLLIVVTWNQIKS